MDAPVTPLLVARLHVDLGRMRSMLCLGAR
jgi:hypothetical protein